MAIGQDFHGSFRNLGSKKPADVTLVAEDRIAFSLDYPRWVRCSLVPGFVAGYTKLNDDSKRRLVHDNTMTMFNLN